MNPQARKAVSPVIATVILVAVAIAVSVGVSYWMSGISAQYTSFEKIEIQTGYATVDPNGLGWTVTLSLKNSGSATATITHVFVNDVPVTLFGQNGLTGDAPIVVGGNIGVDMLETGLTLESGEGNELLVYISHTGVDGTQTEFLSSGTTVNIKLHSAGGMDYIKLIKLV